MAANPHNPTGSSVKQNKTAHRRTHSGGGISNAISNLCKNFGFNHSESETVATTIRKSKSNSTLDNDFETSEKKANCDCTNISIMHLFHEMKQEFPTIPDEIVTKHVNEHCHDKNVCLKLLQEELALHPSPVQTYPSKVLQQLQQALPKKPLKPLRKAPSPQTPTTPTNSISYSALKKQHEDTEQTDKARTRPTTLDLFAAPQHHQQQQQQQQQQQYQMVQVQLKQHIQQQQQHQQRHQQDKPLIVNKPVRKAPLPPVPPKPTHLRSTTTTPTDMFVNVSVISPTVLAKSLPHNKSYTSLPASCMISNNGSKSADQSPIRHRAVLNMQPQVPSVRAYVSTSPTSPVNANGTKSFTSVNLTLRQPGSTDAASPSTIDILAGPGVGAGPGGNGFTYSSTTYNAQKGLQKTFNITVSDEGSEISASRIRSACMPHGCVLEEQTHTPNSPNNTRQRQLSGHHFNFEEENKDMVARLELQKARRDKLANVLRDNKRKLQQMEQKINMLTENISPEVTARLDDEINKLRSDCNFLFSDIEVARKNANQNNYSGTSNSATSRAFPAQRSWQPRSMPALLPHDSCGTPTTSTSSASTPGHYQESNVSERHNESQQHSYSSPTQQHLLPRYNDYNEMSGSDVEVETDDEEDGIGQLDTWACNMCTFRNHPQLNICECCENVRIQPGTIRIVNGAAATAPIVPTNNNNNNNSNAATPNSNLENNSNLTQLALHT